MQIIFKHQCFQDDISDNYDGAIVVILKSVCMICSPFHLYISFFFSGLYSYL